MPKLATFATAGALAAGLALAAGPTAAQTAQPPAAATTAASGFDAYRVMAVTAGVIGGATLAVIVTDGLIIPVYAMATGAPASGMGMVSGMAAGAGAGAGEMAVATGIGHSAAHAAYQAFRGAMTLLGGIGGGFYADAWYSGN